MILLLGSTSLGFGSVFFCVIAKSQLLPSSHMLIFTRSFAQAVRSQVLFWLGQVNTFTDIVSYWSVMSLASIVVLYTLTMLRITHADRGRTTLKDDERFRNVSSKTAS